MLRFVAWVLLCVVVLGIGQQAAQLRQAAAGVDVHAMQVAGRC
jgi:hypothetical protein